MVSSGAGRRRTILAGLVLAQAAAASGLAAQPVNEMTCAAARRQVLATGRFEKETPFGPVPIYGFLPDDGGPNRCPRGTDQSWYVERTLDNPRCALGYTCNERLRVR